MNAILRSRRGMALPMVLGGIVIIGTLISGVMFLAMQDYRVGANTLNETRAAAVADMGLNRVASDWDVNRNNKMITGDTLRLAYTDQTGAKADVLLTRLPGPFFWAVSEAQTRGNSLQYGARRRYGGLLRLNAPDIPFMAALTGRGKVKVGGSALVDGNDHDLGAAYNCPPKGPNLAGVAMSDTTSGLTLPGCDVAKNCVNGTPKFLQTLAAADTATYFSYGNSSYATLAAMANKVIAGGLTLATIAPSVVNGKCQTDLLNNWGDAQRLSPAGACEGYLPLIHVTGDLKVTGGVGQGMLLVDGDLARAREDIAPVFRFRGVARRARVLEVRVAHPAAEPGVGVRGGLVAGHEGVVGVPEQGERVVVHAGQDLGEVAGIREIAVGLDEHDHTRGLRVGRHLPEPLDDARKHLLARLALGHLVAEHAHVLHAHRVRNMLSRRQTQPPATKEIALCE